MVALRLIHMWSTGAVGGVRLIDKHSDLHAVLRLFVYIAYLVLVHTCCGCRRLIATTVRENSAARMSAESTMRYTVGLLSPAFESKLTDAA